MTVGTAAFAAATTFVSLADAFFIIVGLMVIIYGIILRFATVINDQAAAFLPTTKHFDGFLKRWGIEDETVRLPDDTVNVADLLEGPISNAIAVGVCLLCVGFVGVLSFTPRLRKWRLVYVGFLVGTILATAYIYNAIKKGQANQFMKDTVIQSVMPKYKGSRYYESNSVLVNAFMYKHKCCGIYGYTDFIKYAKTWNRTYIRTKDKKRIVVQAPLACCRQNDTFPEGVPIDDSCYTDPNEKNLYTEGCGRMIDHVMEKFNTTTMIITAVLIAMQVLCVLISLLLMWMPDGPSRGQGPVRHSDADKTFIVSEENKTTGYAAEMYSSSAEETIIVDPSGRKESRAVEVRVEPDVAEEADSAAVEQTGPDEKAEDEHGDATPLSEEKNEDVDRGDVE